jgi:hypothetical protein
MTPDQILAALAVQEGLPREAMAEAGARRDDMIPVFLEQIDRLRRTDVDTVDEADRSAFLFVYFLLGEWRDARVYRPLAALLRRDPDFVDSLIGDAITEGTARVIAGVCDGDIQPIFEVIEDPAADQFVRGQMIDALVMIARLRPETHPQVAEYLKRFFLAEFEKPETLWGSWAFAVANLGLEHLEPHVRQAFKREWVSPAEAHFDFFRKQLRKAVESGESPSFDGSRNGRLIENAIEELSGWYAFSDRFAKDRAKERARTGSRLDIFGDTFERDTPRVGRNDPCPCGSGKKFKKCCLQ